MSEIGSSGMHPLRKTVNQSTPGLLLLAFALGLAAAAEAAPAPPPATGTTYYVATTGSDSNSGAPSSPWATITHAAANVSAGATVTVAPGVYNGNVTTNVSGTAAARIRFISEVQFGARIVGTGT